MRGLVIAAPASGQGKTVVTLGLLRALRDRGAPIVSGKSGPDYIDPAFHVAATGRASVTLDAWAAPAEQVRARALMQEREGAELLVVEGAMGAFDGAASASVPAGPASGSAAALAAALGAPMVLVLDVSHMAQSAGALVHGMAAWAEAAGTRLAGVILNRVASPRHGAMVEGAVQATCPVLGAVPRDADLSIPSRHLGLVQAAEQRDLEDLILRAAGLVASGVDLDALEGMAAPIAAAPVPRRIAPLGQRIAVARDEAFGFSYWHMLEDWGAQGAEVVPFSPLADEPADPTADAVFLPGGYPELHAGRIANAG
ncbi:MAG: cobyrinate a,c-diamide synthase, partial [Pseudomonadota bacterium]